MRGRLPAVIFVFLLSFTGDLRAEGLDEFLLRLQQAAAATSAWQADFTQEKHLSIFKEPVVFQGRLSLVRPDRLRWEFFTPVSSVLILNKESGMRCGDGMAPVTVDLNSDPMMSVVSRQLWLWLGGDYRSLGEQYEIGFAADDSTLVVQPKKDSAGNGMPIEVVILRFDPVSLEPQQVEIHERDGDYTLLRFHHSRSNPELPPQLFSSCNGDGQ